MRIRRLTNPGKDEVLKIEEFTKGFSFPNYFHSYAHFLGAKANPSTQPEFFLALDNEGNIKGLALVVTHRATEIILKSVTRRTVLYGPPLASDINIEKGIIDFILDYVKKRHLFLQFRINNDQHPVLNTFNGVFSAQDYLNVFVYNEGGSKAWESLSRSKRWQVRKNIAAGVSIAEAQTDEEFNQWYTILKRLYDNKIKKPVPPKGFFSALIQASTEQNSTRLLVVKYQKNVIGGILLPISGKRAVHEWYVCGMDEEYKSKNIFPSVMATWGAIDYTVQNQFEFFDFMGAGRPEIPYGVREFKERFGGELINVVRYTHFPDNFYARLFRKFNFI